MNHEYNDIINQILPTERDAKIYEEVTKILISNIKESSENFSVFSVIPCGSVAKGTDLKDDADIDIFVILKTTSKELLESYVKEVGKKIAKKMNVSCKIGYAENPYLYLTLKNKGKEIVVNIVPTIRITELNPLDKALKII